MTLNYTQIFDETLKQKFKALVQSGHATGGVALTALKEQLDRGDESELDWVVSNLRRLSLPWGYCLHHAKAPKCPYGQNACFTKDNGPCHTRLRVVAAISIMQSQNSPINFNTVCHAARVSKTFLYDPKHSDLAGQIRSLRLSNAQSPVSTRTNSNKSDSAKDAQIARFKERVRTLEEQVRALQEENELLYGKLSSHQP